MEEEAKKLAFGHSCRSAAKVVDEKGITWFIHKYYSNALK